MGIVRIPGMQRFRAALREVWHQRALAGPYRYVVRRWDDVSDVDLAIRVLETGFFEKALRPVPLPVETLKSVLVLAPHQDDETLGAGGTLLMARGAGARIDVLFATDGVQAETPYAVSRRDAAIIREGEAANVCASLGAGIHKLGISNLAPRPARSDVDALAGLVRELQPQVIMAPWILDSPAKHRLVNHLLWAAARLHELPSCEVWGYQVHNTPVPNGYVEITSVAAEKLRLLEFYRSQNLYCQCYDHLGMAMSAWNSRFLDPSPARRYVELFFTLPLTDLISLIDRFYFNDLRATYRGNESVLDGMRAFHAEICAS